MRQSTHSIGSRGHKVLDKKADVGTEESRADPFGHQGMWSDGLKKRCPPNISVLAANSRVLPAGLHVHVIEGRLPYHVVCPCKLDSISRLQGWNIWTDPKPKCLTRPREPCFLSSSLITSHNLRSGNGRDPQHPHCAIQGNPSLTFCAVRK